MRPLSTEITLIALQSQESVNEFSVIALEMKVMGMNVTILIFLVSLSRLKNHVQVDQEGEAPFASEVDSSNIVAAEKQMDT